MIITQLEGKVSSGQWDALKQAFHEASQQLPPAIERSYLVQDENERVIWRILTVWYSRQVLEDYRATVDTPGGILIFRAANAEPTLSIYEVYDHASND